MHVGHTEPKGKLLVNSSLLCLEKMIPCCSMRFLGNKLADKLDHPLLNGVTTSQTVLRGDTEVEDPLYPCSVNEEPPVSLSTLVV